MTRMLVCLIGMLALTACTNENAPPGRNESDGWTTITDETTDRTFRCFNICRSGGYDGGPAMWCYEPGAED